MSGRGGTCPPPCWAGPPPLALVEAKTAVRNLLVGAPTSAGIPMSDGSATLPWCRLTTSSIEETALWMLRPAACFSATIPAWCARTSAIAATTSDGARFRASRTKDSLDSVELRTSKVTCRLGTAEADATSSRVHFHARAARASHRGASVPWERGEPADRTLSRPRPPRTARDAGVASFGGRPRMRASGVRPRLCSGSARLS